MSQILCWNIEYLPQDKPENYVQVTSQETILKYLVPTTIIIFDQQIFSVKNNLLFLTLLKLSYPFSILIFLDGNTDNTLFNCIKRKDLPNFLSAQYSRKFFVENKKKSMIDAFNIIKSNLNI